LYNGTIKVFGRGQSSRSGRAVLGDGLGALRNGVLGEFSGEEESHGSLDLSG